MVRTHPPKQTQNAQPSARDPGIRNSSFIRTIAVAMQKCTKHAIVSAKQSSLSAQRSTNILNTYTCQQRKRIRLFRFTLLSSAMDTRNKSPILRPAHGTYFRNGFFANAGSLDHCIRYHFDRVRPRIDNPMRWYCKSARCRHGDAYARQHRRAQLCQCLVPSSQQRTVVRLHLSAKVSSPSHPPSPHKSSPIQTP